VPAARGGIDRRGRVGNDGRVPITVMKFGGSSVADAEKIRRCAQRAYDARRGGADVVVVVSAMGKTTDGLIDLATQISEHPPKREMDQLLAAGEQVSIALTAMALQGLGQEAVSLTGPQCGLRTDAAYTKARIQSIDRDRILRHLERGRVVVVAGFQGVDEDGSVTTLGRGGSDTTAVALAAALQGGGAPLCEIYTDVEGIYTADPRVEPSARKLERISYEEIIELAALGAKVMATRAVSLGMKFGVPIHVRHAMLPDSGTLITKETPEMEKDEVTGVALKSSVGRVMLTDLPADPALQARLFGAIADANILVDDIIQNQVGPDRINISFTLDDTDLGDARPVLERLLAGLGDDGARMRIDVGLCRVAAVGVGMRTQSGVAARMFKALAAAEGGPIPIENITTSDIKIACIIPKEAGQRAVRAVHREFGLGRDSEGGAA
jgi:aspartate kinase